MKNQNKIKTGYGAIHAVKQILPSGLALLKCGDDMYSYESTDGEITCKKCLKVLRKENAKDGVDDGR